MKLRHYIQFGTAALVAAVAGVSCSDTWDEHYATETGAGLAATETLWELLQKDADLAPFVEVLDSCGYGRVLSSGQAYTVWAPVISKAKAKELIDAYKADKSRGVKDEDNTTVKQFILNHLALYNRQITSTMEALDTVTMLNGKRMTYSYTTFNDNLTFDTEARMNASNGVAYKLKGSGTELYEPYYANVWEAIRQGRTAATASESEKDNGLDSLYAFLDSFTEIYLDENASVPGEIIDGQTHYLDSVTVEYNRLFSSYGDINDEDSLMWFLAPNNKVWRERTAAYEQFYVYHDSLRKVRGNAYVDSLQYTHARLQLVCPSFFNPRFQPGAFNAEHPDSICSTIYTSYRPGAYVFPNPMDADGIFGGLEPVDCSNGRLYRPGADEESWRILPEETFLRPFRTDLNSTYYHEVVGNNSNVAVSLPDTSLFYNQMVRNNYLRVQWTGNRNARRPSGVFKLFDLLSNCPYNIKVVFAPIWANTYPLVDTLGNGADRDKVRMRPDDPRFPAPDAANFPDECKDLALGATLYYCKSPSALPSQSDYYTPVTFDNFTVSGMKMDTIQLNKEPVMFPVCTYGIDYVTRAKLDIHSSVRGQRAPESFAVDCIILEPVFTPGIEWVYKNNSGTRSLRLVRKN